MKRLIPLLIVLLSITSVIGQSATTKTLQKFTELKVYDRIKVTLKKGKENKLELSGKNREDVIISENDGMLKIKMKFEETLSGNTISAILFYTENLTLIDANENAKIQANEEIKGTQISIKAQEASLISLSIEMDYITAKSTTGSEITLKGMTKGQELDVNTGGIIYAKDLLSENCEVIVLAGGHADVNGTKKVVAKVKAGGSINVYGRPKSLETDDTFGGNIKIMQ